MARFARRMAPAAALGGLAVVIVGVADPAIANLGAVSETKSVVTPPADSDSATLAGSGTPDAGTSDTGTSDAGTSDAGTSDTGTSDAGTSDAGTSDAGTSDAGQEAGADCSTGDTITGDSPMTPWGPVQVAATVSGGAICEVHAVSWPANDRKSQMINSYAIPILDEAATASQGTQIDFVSGATYTSNGYAQSLQSILDQL
jgi:uncharacterized protein with FMN-binding domain